ncbi:MAG TPA: hypothetical protein VFV53_00510 [Candidatus Limnocylindrales bacterium]|nr:hypothetical protein [Candidatus Limnocylindrales bacterium]
MTTDTGQSRPVAPSNATELFETDPFSVPCIGLGAPPTHPSGTALPGMPAGATTVSVLRVDPPRIVGPLARGATDDRTIVFPIDATAGRELQAALDAGEEPIAIVEPEQVVATDIDIVR